MKRIDPQAYARYFAPHRRPDEGPSGLADPPRPFVLRGPSVPTSESSDAGGPIEIGLNLFLIREPAVGLFTRAMAELGELSVVEGTVMLRLTIPVSERPVHSLQVRFLTPTELKGADRPEFGALMSRIRDRISALRALYSAGPLDIDFKEFGEQAARVRMTRCDLEYVDAERVSRGTGQRHSLGGFTGIAEYEGDDLAPFVPYLEIGRWTGVGRQTVWGKGQIAYDEL